MIRSLPDPQIHLRDAADFIINSPLGRKALECRKMSRFPIFLRDLISEIYRLTTSCHLPEFTDHGLPHLCSLVDRVSQWTFLPASGSFDYLVNVISEDEAAVLLLAILFHDIGMLSQRPEDLEIDQPELKTKGHTDISTWVRNTHVERIKKLVLRLFCDSQQYGTLLRSKNIAQTFKIAKAHTKWPWERDFVDLSDMESGLAAIVAIADLLDEDSNRCDTFTLIHHRQGNMLNIAHWIRHSLTWDRVMVKNGQIKIKMAWLPETDSQIDPVYAALRNHYRLVRLYNESLNHLGIGSLDIEFDPESGIPTQEALELRKWQSIPGLQNQKALVFNLLKSFFPLALKDNKRESAENIKRIKEFDMEDIDLESFHEMLGIVETHSSYEQGFSALLGEQE